MGRHHADAEGRKRFDPDEARGRGLSEAEISVLSEHQAAQDELDLPHGTEVHHDLTLPNGEERVEWTGNAGLPRATAIPAAFFAEHFVKLPGAPETPTMRSVQEHEFERGAYERPPWRPQLKAVHVRSDFEHEAIVSDLGVVGASTEGGAR